jgi:integrase
VTKDPRWIGIYRHGAGWRAVVSNGRGKLVTKHFPLDTAVHVMQAWRADERARLRLKRKDRTNYGTFEADAKRYLAAVVAMPSYTDRARDINLWVAEFNNKQRDHIKAVDIRTVRDRWLTQPLAVLPDGTTLPPYAASTVNHRLRALSNLWTVLDGPRAPNPVREVPEAKEPSTRPRALDYATITAILDAMPDQGRAEKRGDTRPQGSKSKARLRVLAYTGWPASTLAKLTRADIDLTRGTARLPDRRKGQGAAGTTVTLTSQAVEALRIFDKLDCWVKPDETLSNSALGKSFRRAARSLNITDVRVYDLRHSHLTALALASKDERAVQAHAGHADIRTTRRYTEGAIEARMAAATVALEANLVKQFGKTPSPDVPQSPTKRPTSEPRRSRKSGDEKRKRGR